MTSAQYQWASEPELTSGSASPRVGIVVVHYNNLHDTMRCLRSLRRLNYPNYFVILIDNNSPNGSGRVLQSVAEPNHVFVVLNPENSGFAGGNNLGIRHALEYDADFVWLVNPDASVEPDSLTKLIEEAERHPHGAMFGSKILYGETGSSEQTSSSKQKIWGAGGRINVRARQIEMVGSRELDDGQHETLRECDYLPGCSLLIRSEDIARFGLMPEEFFMYFEETDWCAELKTQGRKLFYVPESIVWHHFDDEKGQTPFSVYYYNRNELLFWFRRSSWGGKAKLIFRVLFKDLPHIQHALSRAPSELRPIFQAHRASRIDFLLGRFGKRRY